MERIDKLFASAAEFYSNGDPGHDLAHVRRVMKHAERLAESEGGDREVVLAAAMLHDVVNVPKNHPDREKASALAAEKSQSLLIEAGFSGAEVDRIGQAIVEHSYSLGRAPSSLEAAILQDADRLDALGAIGIFRTASCGVTLGAVYYHPDDPFADTRELDDKSYTVDHFYRKLLKLPDQMNTASARAEAHRRADFMRAFLAELKLEIE